MKFPVKPALPLLLVASMSLLQACSAADDDAASASAATTSTAEKTTNASETTSEEETSEFIDYPAKAEPGVGDYTLDPTANTSDFAISVVNADGSSAFSDTAETVYPALSLAKLFIGYWMLENTTGYEDEVQLMIEYSDDAVATTLDSMYPQAIAEVAEEFGLVNTSRNGFWGSSTTSAIDMAVFLAHVLAHNPDSLLLTYMANVAEIASDGYTQDFGTAVLPGVIGTKFGWSDDRSFHATVSYGSNFVVAAFGYGSPAALTAAVENSVVLVTE